MNDRERWIVYPLLFLALGAALRDKLAKQTSAKQIVCEQLYLVDAEGGRRGCSPERGSPSTGAATGWWWRTRSTPRRTFRAIGRWPKRPGSCC